MRSRRLQADDFFSPNKWDRARPTTAPADAALVDAHEFRVRMSPTSHEKRLFKAGLSPTVGLRIVENHSRQWYVRGCIMLSRFSRQLNRH